MQTRHMKHRHRRTIRIVLAILGILLLSALYLEERRPYEILHSTVMSSPNLTENKMTIVVHSLLPIDKKALVKEIVRDHQRLNGDRPNPYYDLELYRTGLHYRLGIVFDTFLCNGEGHIVFEIRLQDTE